jgi:hypothetical protein
MEIKKGIIILMYAEVLSSNVFAIERHIQYRRGHGQDSTNDIKCGAQKVENKYAAVKIPLDDESEICHGLERDWLLDKRYDDGYHYIEKEKVVEIFKPPIQVIYSNIFEPRHDKTNIMGLRPAWIQTSLRIRTV